MALRHSYTLLAPLYDTLVTRGTAPMRQSSLAQLPEVNGKSVLLAGVGTGLDFPYLPRGANYVGVDITPAMLQRATQARPVDLSIELRVADVQQLPFADNQFDHVILHLILAVVPNSPQTLQEAARVVKPGGTILVLDKFLHRGQRAPLRRILNLLLRHVATRTDVVFEDVLQTCPNLQLRSDIPTMAGGWFRRIVLQKNPLTS